MLNTRSNIALACALSALAGYVDGVGFIHLGGLFVSFMSGNSTRLGVDLANGQWMNAAEAFGLIVLFVAGAALGGLIVIGGNARRQKWVLLTEALFLFAAAGAALSGYERIAVAAIVVAMGLENAVFQIEGGAGLGLTYVTGALVKVGQLIAAALRGGAPLAWLPNLLLWAALVAGASLGALAYRSMALLAIGPAAVVALLLGAMLFARDRRHARDQGSPRH